MDPIQLTIVAVSFILTGLVVALGIQVWYILKEIRTAITKTNAMLDDAKKVTNTVGDSVTSMSGVFSGIKAAFSVLNTYRKRKKHEDD